MEFLIDLLSQLATRRYFKMFIHCLSLMGSVFNLIYFKFSNLYIFLHFQVI